MVYGFYLMMLAVAAIAGVENIGIWKAVATFFIAFTLEMALFAFVYQAFR